jgi:hypothetical protein
MKGNNNSTWPEYSVVTPGLLVQCPITDLTHLLTYQYRFTLLKGTLRSYDIYNCKITLFKSSYVFYSQRRFWKDAYVYSGVDCTFPVLLHVHKMWDYTFPEQILQYHQQERNDVDLTR